MRNIWCFLDKTNSYGLWLLHLTVQFWKWETQFHSLHQWRLWTHLYPRPFSSNPIFSVPPSNPSSSPTAPKLRVSAVQEFPHLPSLASWRPLKMSTTRTRAYPRRLCCRKRHRRWRRKVVEALEMGRFRQSQGVEVVVVWWGWWRGFPEGFWRFCLICLWLLEKCSLLLL